MINVDAEVSRYKNCKDRDELVRAIKDYKDKALQFAANLVMAGQYTAVAHKLQEICDKLPAPHIIKHTAARNVPTKTANITKDEKKRIDADWRKKTQS